MKIVFSILLFIIQLASVSAQKEILTSAVDWPLGLAVHNDILYIVEADLDRISKLDLNTPNAVPEVFVKNLDNPAAIELYGDDLYITERSLNSNTGKISKIDLTATDPVPVTILSDLLKPKDLVLLNTELYFSESNRISKIDLTETNPIPITVSANLGIIVSIAIDGAYLFYSEYLENRISKIDLSVPNSAPIPVLTDLEGPLGSMMVLDRKLYFFEFDLKTISTISIDSVGVDKIIFDTDLNAGDIMIYGNDIYVSDFVDDLVIKYANVITSIDNPILSAVTIFPNPTTDFLEIKGIEAMPDFLITTAAGELVSKSNSLNGNRIDVSALASGNYVLVFENGEAHRFVKL